MLWGSYLSNEFHLPQNPTSEGAIATSITRTIVPNLHSDIFTPESIDSHHFFTISANNSVQGCAGVYRPVLDDSEPGHCWAKTLSGATSAGCDVGLSPAFGDMATQLSKQTARLGR